VKIIVTISLSRKRKHYKHLDKNVLNLFEIYRQKMAKEKQEKDLQEQDAPEVVEQETEEVQEEPSEVEILEEQLQVEKDKFLRLFAEFENFKRRTAKERMELFKTAGEGVLKDMLPVLDDFDRAMIEINKSEDEQLTSGIKLISGKLRSTLINKGLEELDVRAGDTFNADIHEAITQIPAPSDDMKGKIVDVIEKGYKLGDKIIRFPKVVIGQ
jgi:molecular chaperone GrpE